MFLGRSSGSETASYDVFQSILADCARTDVRVQDFWEYWEERNIAHYWEPYRPYKEICELSLGEAFAHFGIRGNPSLIRRYFDAFRGFEHYPDVLPTLDVLGRRHRLAIVSNNRRRSFGCDPAWPGV
jgi:2-haloacid dehalogenase